MRWLRLLLALISARYKTKLVGTETVRKSFRVWLTDIDVSVMNHAAIMTVLETGRLDLMVRSGFFKVASENKWFFPSQAISVQFYRPLKVFQKAVIHTRISYVDDKWIYVEQKIERNQKLVAACIVKNTIKKGRDTVPTSKIMEALEIEGVPTDRYPMLEAYELETNQMNARLKVPWGD